eukprot:TRINITY_DN4113_c0_g1_i2.p1 TRINITY_DN4113_c0_g1~~TRINITY_DN4113_c0_g1_i2.p1  ORF type:complete len:915 (+),score=202.75 TRINITY_DN4113_c0_g1_i2:30-2774(+)
MWNPNSRSNPSNPQDGAYAAYTAYQDPNSNPPANPYGSQYTSTTPYQMQYNPPTIIQNPPPTASHNPQTLNSRPSYSSSTWSGPNPYQQTSSSGYNTVGRQSMNWQNPYSNPSTIMTGSTFASLNPEEDRLAQFEEETRKRMELLRRQKAEEENRRTQMVGSDDRAMQRRIEEEVQRRIAEEERRKVEEERRRMEDQIRIGVEQQMRAQVEEELRRDEVRRKVEADREAQLKQEELRRHQAQREAEERRLKEEQARRWEQDKLKQEVQRAEAQRLQQLEQQKRDEAERLRRQEEERLRRQEEADKLKKMEDLERQFQKREALLRWKEEEVALRREEDTIRAELQAIQDEEEHLQLEQDRRLKQAEQERRQQRLEQKQEQEELARQRQAMEAKLRAMELEMEETRRARELEEQHRANQLSQMQAELHKREQLLMAASAAPAKPAEILDNEINPSDLQYGPLIGKGAFGDVWQAKLFGKEVAVKKMNGSNLDDVTLKAFRSEISVISKLRHPNIILFMGACLQAEHLMIVTELAMGSVESILQSKPGQIPFRQKVSWIKDTILGMNWLHCYKPPIIHLDLKAGNLLVDKNNNVKVSDFGLSKIRCVESEAGTMGTPLWMAPELLSDQSYTERVDVYSFAITLYEIYTEKEPYTEDLVFQSMSDLVEAVCIDRERPRLPPHTPPSFKKLTEQCWQADPSDRPSFQELSQSKELDFSIIETEVADVDAAQFWVRSFGDRLQVSWGEFLTAFCEFKKIGKSSMQTYRRELMALNMVLAHADPQGDGVNITLNAFRTVVTLFGPWDSAVLERLMTVASKNYFFGSLSEAEVDTALVLGKKTWLVRIENRGVFTLSARDKKSKDISHCDIIPDVERTAGLAVPIFSCRGRNFPSFEQAVTFLKKELSLGDPAPGSRFVALN